jgi:hypothetical protein
LDSAPHRFQQAYHILVILLPTFPLLAVGHCTRKIGDERLLFF